MIASRRAGSVTRGAMDRVRVPAGPSYARRSRKGDVGFFDKVKAQATQLKEKEKVKELTHKVKEKVDDVQHKRKANDLLDDLGRFLYADKTGRPIPGAESEIARLVAELKVLEDDGLKILPEPSDN